MDRVKSQFYLLTYLCISDVKRQHAEFLFNHFPRLICIYNAKGADRKEYSDSDEQTEHARIAVFRGSALNIDVPYVATVIRDDGTPEWNQDCAETIEWVNDHPEEADGALLQARMLFHGRKTRYLTPKISSF
jgi:hypothetical protein